MLFSLQTSEGHLYNIISHGDLRTIPNNKVNIRRSLTKKSLGFELIAQQKEAGESKARESDQRRLNRISYDRWKSERQRGYNLVTTQPQSVMSPSTMKPVSSWQKLQNNATIPKVDYTADVKNDLNSSIPITDNRKTIPPKKCHSLPTLDISNTIPVEMVTKMEPTDAGTMLVQTTSNRRGNVRTGGLYH